MIDNLPGDKVNVKTARVTMDTCSRNPGKPKSILSHLGTSQRMHEIFKEIFVSMCMLCVCICVLFSFSGRWDPNW